MDKTKELNKKTKKLTPQKRSRKKKRRPARISPWWLLPAFFLLAILILYPYIRSGRFATTGASVPPNAQHFCLDVSHYNESIVWDSLKVVIDRKGRTSKDLLKARRILPLSHVIIKATEGESMTDACFARYWQEAGDAGYSRGAYHFFRSSKSPAEQARNYIRTVTLRHSDLPPVLDVETMHRGCSREQLNAAVLEWLRIVEAHYGRKPLVYTSDSYARDILSPEITSVYPMWIARYHAEPPRFEGWRLWQFTDKAVLQGVEGYVDLSVIQ